MPELDYKTVTAPRRLRKVKGVKGADELLAYTIGELIEEQAAEGWRYLRADRFVVEEKTGFFSSVKTVERTVLVFARERRRRTQAAAQASYDQPAPAQPQEPLSAAPAYDDAPGLGGARD